MGSLQQPCVSWLILNRRAPLRHAEERQGWSGPPRAPLHQFFLLNSTFLPGCRRSSKPRRAWHGFGAASAPAERLPSLPKASSPLPWLRPLPRSPLTVSTPGSPRSGEAAGGRRRAPQAPRRLPSALAGAARAPRQRPPASKSARAPPPALARKAGGACTAPRACSPPSTRALRGGAPVNWGGVGRCTSPRLCRAGQWRAGKWQAGPCLNPCAAILWGAWSCVGAVLAYRKGLEIS